MLLREMDQARVRSVAGKMMILVGLLLLFLLPTLWNEMVVDHHQVYELESRGGFSAGVVSANDSTPIWGFDQPLTWDVGEADLGGGEHSLWVERFDGTDTMWDVVNLHLEDEEGWVVYHRPIRARFIERNGVEYELMFIFDVNSPGNHLIESMGSDPDLRGEEVQIMVSHTSEEDPLLFLPGLLIFLCGVTLLIYNAVRRRQVAVQD